MVSDFFWQFIKFTNIIVTSLQKCIYLVKIWSTWQATQWKESLLCLVIHCFIVKTKKGCVCVNMSLLHLKNHVQTVLHIAIYTAVFFGHSSSLYILYIYIHIYYALVHDMSWPWMISKINSNVCRNVCMLFLNMYVYITMYCVLYNR